MAVSPEVQRLIDRATAYWQSFENGEFDQGDAVTEIELRSQFGSVNAELVDDGQYACSSAASLYCGTGGCMLNLVVNGETMAWQATGRRRIDWGPDRLLLIGRHGGWCGGGWRRGVLLSTGLEQRPDIDCGS
jgi:hypothetical protein